MPRRCPSEKAHHSKYKRTDTSAESDGSSRGCKRKREKYGGIDLQPRVHVIWMKVSPSHMTESKCCMSEFEDQKRPHSHGHSHCHREKSHKDVYETKSSTTSHRQKKSVRKMYCPHAHGFSDDMWQVPPDHSNCKNLKTSTSKPHIVRRNKSSTVQKSDYEIGTHSHGYSYYSNEALSSGRKRNAKERCDKSATLVPAKPSRSKKRSSSCKSSIFSKTQDEDSVPISYIPARYQSNMERSRATIARLAMPKRDLSRNYTPPEAHKFCHVHSSELDNYPTRHRPSHSHHSYLTPKGSKTKHKHPTKKSSIMNRILSCCSNKSNKKKTECERMDRAAVYKHKHPNDDQHSSNMRSGTNEASCPRRAQPNHTVSEHVPKKRPKNTVNYTDSKTPFAHGFVASERGDDKSGRTCVGRNPLAAKRKTAAPKGRTTSSCSEISPGSTAKAPVKKRHKTC